MLDINANTIALISAIVTITGAGFTAFMLYRKTKSDLSEDVISTYRIRVEQLETAMRELTTKVETLMAQNKAKDDHIKSLELIFQNRNPELDEAIKNGRLQYIEARKYMEEMRAFTGQAKAWMERVDKQIMKGV